MPVPVVYRKSNEIILSNFDYSEISTGREIKKLYCCDMQNVSGTAIYQLMEGVTYAQEGQFVITAGSFDLDYNMTINKSIVLQGSGSVSIPLHYSSAGASVQNENVSAFIDFYKVVAGTESFLCSGSTALKSTVATVPSWNKRALIDFQMPITNFTNGEVLRLNIRTGTLAGTRALWMGCDPKNRTTWQNLMPAGYDAVDCSAMGSECYAHVPIKIDL
jgi:hypothetical protein